MSRQEQFASKSNPATLKLSWKSTAKKFAAYNTITKEQVNLGDFKFIVLTKTICISGFNEPSGLGIFSNEIKNTTSEELIVRTKNGILLQGLYADIKDKLKAQGASFATNLYVLLSTGQVAILQLSGAALKVWFEYEAANKDKVGTHWVTITGVEAKKKGAVNYTVPTLTLGAELNADENNTAETQYEAIVAYRKSIQAPKSIEDAKPMVDDIPWD